LKEGVKRTSPGRPIQGSQAEENQGSAGAGPDQSPPSTQDEQPREDRGNEDGGAVAGDEGQAQRQTPEESISTDSLGSVETLERHQQEGGGK
jgi:hypothetical protein